MYHHVGVVILPLLCVAAVTFRVVVSAGAESYMNVPTQGMPIPDSGLSL